MKIHCEKEALLKSINIALRAVPVRTTMPILNCLYLQAFDNVISLSANDMELAIRTEIIGEVIEEGSLALDAKILSDIVRHLPDAMVTLETEEGDRVVIRCEQAVFHISYQTGEDFPELPEVERRNHIALSSFTLKEMVRQTIFAISDTGTNRMMTGELFEVKENRLRMVALDGHRISIRTVNLEESYDAVKVVIPGKTLNEISRVISGEADDIVTLFFTENHVVFEFDDTTVVSRLIEGEYFRIDQMLSNDYETKLCVNRRELAGCIERASLLVRESDKKPVIIRVEDGSMQLSLKSVLGSLREVIPVEKTGRDILIGFNPRFLQDVLRVVDDETITIYMVNPKAPCFIRNEAAGYNYLVLPVNFGAGDVD